MAHLTDPPPAYTLPFSAPLKDVKEASEDILSLPVDEIVRKALRRLSEHTHLILWGALLDWRMSVPRIQKHFTFLVPDDKLDTLSAELTQMGLPLTTLPNHLINNEGDFLRRSRLHRVTQAIDCYRLQCIHLVPASLPGYTEDELEPTPLDGTTATLYVPRPSAVYAGILRMMRKYRKFCSERYKLQSDLELLIYYNLLGFEKMSAGDDIEDSEFEKRSAEAAERIRGWGRAGQWREGEEWMEDALVGIVKGEKDIATLPHLGSTADGKNPRTPKPLVRMDDSSETVWHTTVYIEVEDEPPFWLAHQPACRFRAFALILKTRRSLHLSATGTHATYHARIGRLSLLRHIGARTPCSLYGTAFALATDTGKHPQMRRAVDADDAVATSTSPLAFHARHPADCPHTAGASCGQPIRLDASILIADPRASAASGQPMTTTTPPATAGSTAPPTHLTADAAGDTTTTTTPTPTSEPSEKAPRLQDPETQAPPTGFAHRYLPRFIPFFATFQRPRRPRDRRRLREKAGDEHDSADEVPRPSMTEKAGQTYYVIRPEPPALHFKLKPRNPLLYFLFLVSCNVILPVLLFYPLIHFTPLELRDVVGISSSALGLSSCFDAPMRLWKLTKHRTSFGPLNSTRWFHLDFSMWFYTTAMLVFAIPLIIAPTVPVYDMFNMATVMLILPAGIMFALTIIPLSPRLENWRRRAVPVQITSDGVVKAAPVGLRVEPVAPGTTAPSHNTSATHIEQSRSPPTTHFYEAFDDDEDPNQGHAPYTAVDAEHAAPYTTPYLPSEEDPDDTRVKPAMFYVIEDIVAVDFGYRRPWRRRLRARWRASPPFREHMRRQTAYWVFASIFHAGITAATTWGSSFRFAFGWNLGMFFMWALIAGYCSWLLAQHELENEHTWWVDRERALWADARARAGLKLAPSQPHAVTSEKDAEKAGAEAEMQIEGKTAHAEGRNAAGQIVDGIEIVGEPEEIPSPTSVASQASRMDRSYSLPAVEHRARFSDDRDRASYERGRASYERGRHGRPSLHGEHSEPAPITDDSVEIVGVRDHHGRLRAAQREAGAPDAPGVVRLDEVRRSKSEHGHGHTRSKSEQQRSKSERRRSMGSGLRRRSESRRRHSEQGPRPVERSKSEGDHDDNITTLFIQSLHCGHALYRPEFISNNPSSLRSTPVQSCGGRCQYWEKLAKEGRLGKAAGATKRL
ncbi:hypothetical protein K525DRAFT_252679 [Schizophyllum commune Loenen D]|nr:hypothetical protein K525DRAFT_252679 [Schizophyllum commune Loenen D]